MTAAPIQPTFQIPVPPKLRLLLEALKTEIGKEINCVRIGIVQSFNAANQTATIEIAQQQVTSTQPNGTQTLAAFPLLVQVPVMFPCGGGYTLTFPITAGDECIVLFNDRELDNWLESGGTKTVPTTPRLHSLADGIAIVGLRSFPRSLSNVSTTTTQLRSDDGETLIDIDGAGEIVTVTAPTQINLNSPVVNIQGVLNVENVNASTAPCNINGTVIATGDVKSNSGGHSLSTHVHGGVQTGSGDTGGPIG